MEWSRVKSILICVFLVVNLVLLKVYVDGNSSQTLVDSATIENTVTVLGSKNIIIDKALIPDKVSDVDVFNITNKYKTTAEHADVLYTAAKNAGIDYFNPQSTEINENLVVYTGLADSVSAVKKNIARTGALSDYKTKCTVTQSDNKTVIMYNVMCNGLLVYDTYIKAVIENDTLTVTLNNWLGDKYKQTGLSSVKSATEAFISFSNAVSFEQPFEVAEVASGYVAGNRNGEIQTATATPVWKITGVNGETYYIDMRNGDFLAL